MTSYDAFFFDDYKYDAASGALRLHYSFKNGPAFEETVTFPVPEEDLPSNTMLALDHAFRLIFLLAGTSYYKACVPQRLECKAFPLDKAAAAFFEKTYLNGLGEFAYRNKLDLSGKINFSAASTAPEKPISLPPKHKLLVPVGGGKDSIVSIETLKQAGEPVTLFALASAAGIAAPIAETITASALPSITVRRALSPNLVELNKAGALNGHVPITAILSAIAVATAILHDFDAVVMSNEHGASAPNLQVGGRAINHQYSKSFEFEQDFAHYVAERISPSIAYFSLLRPLSETDIARRFTKFDKYHGVFRSCNTAFRQELAARGKNWCCECPKCRFVFLALAPFMEKQHLTEIFGKDMLDDPAQREGYTELCGLSAHKPFECVGEIEESALLMQKLHRSPVWKDDVIVRELGGKLDKDAKDFDARFNALFTLSADHRVPEKFLRMLDARR